MPERTERIGVLKGYPLYLLAGTTVDGCERIVWGEPVRDKRWSDPQYHHPEHDWGTAFNPSSEVGQIGFCDVTITGIAPHDRRLDNYLMRIRIGISHQLRSKGLGHLLQRFCETYATRNDLSGIAAFNPPPTFEYPGYREFTDTARRRWMVKTF